MVSVHTVWCYKEELDAPLLFKTPKSYNNFLPSLLPIDDLFPKIGLGAETTLRRWSRGYIVPLDCDNLTMVAEARLIGTKLTIYCNYMSLNYNTRVRGRPYFNDLGYLEFSKKHGGDILYYETASAADHALSINK